MKHMGVKISAALAAAALASISCAQAPAAAAFSKADWTVTKVSCPIGCPEPIRRFLQSQLGQKLHLSTTALDAPFLDKCDGEVRWQLHAAPLTTVVAAVNRGVAPGQQLVRAADLALAPDTLVTSGAALCAGRYGALTMARVLTVTADRVVFLFEQQSLIELR